MVRFLILGLLILPATGIASVFSVNTAESLVSDLAFIMDKGGSVSQEVNTVSWPFDPDFSRRVDVYTAPCGSGFVVWVGDNEETISRSYGCEVRPDFVLKKDDAKVISEI